MSKQVISEIANRQAFFNLLEHNPGLIIIKLGSSWCGPCKLIEKSVHGFFASSPPEVVCADIDVDQSFDFYSFLKSKKMVNGIPVLLCYKKGNATYIPDDSVTGADPQGLHQFFSRCGKHLMDALTQYPPKQVKK
jgi:thioredoxin-like negative regulator of GroEL